jgi:hypothetical protein
VFGINTLRSGVIFSVLCLCNLSNANPGNLAREVVDVYLAKELQRADGMSDPSGNNYSPNAAAFAGKYLDPRNHRRYTFTASDGNLEAWGSVLRRRSANEFYDLLGNVIKFERQWLDEGHARYGRHNILRRKQSPGDALE